MIVQETPPSRSWATANWRAVAVREGLLPPSPIQAYRASNGSSPRKSNHTPGACRASRQADSGTVWGEAALERASLSRMPTELNRRSAWLGHTELQSGPPHRRQQYARAGRRLRTVRSPRGRLPERSVRDLKVREDDPASPGALIHQPVEHQHPDREHHGGEGEQQDQQVLSRSTVFRLRRRTRLFPSMVRALHQ